MESVSRMGITFVINLANQTGLTIVDKSSALTLSGILYFVVVVVINKLNWICQNNYTFSFLRLFLGCCLWKKDFISMNKNPPVSFVASQ